MGIVLMLPDGRWQDIHGGYSWLIGGNPPLKEKKHTHTHTLMTYPWIFSEEVGETETQKNFGAEMVLEIFFCFVKVGCGPLPVTVANEGLGWDPLLKMVHNPGGHWNPVRGPHPMLRSSVCRNWIFASLRQKV